MTPSEKFGESLRLLRKKNDWSQEDLAKILNTTKQVISNYENSKRSPNIYVAAEYAKALGVSLEEMLGVEPYEQKKDDRLEALHQNPKLCQLFDRQRRMSDEDIDKMLQLSDWIVKENYGE